MTPSVEQATSCSQVQRTTDIFRIVRVRDCMTKDEYKFESNSQECT